MCKRLKGPSSPLTCFVWGALLPPSRWSDIGPTFHPSSFCITILTVGSSNKYLHDPLQSVSIIITIDLHGTCISALMVLLDLCA